MKEDYVRNARLIKVIDGDTVDLDVDLGFRIWMQLRVRVLGVNCPETKGETKAAGIAATIATAAWLETAGPLVVQTHLDKRDSFGRCLAEIRSARTNESLGETLLKSGHAVPFMG